MKVRIRGALASSSLQVKDPRVFIRLVLGALLLANLVAAVIAFKPFGGSAEDLARRQELLFAQVSDLERRVARTKGLAEKVERARVEGEAFLNEYTMDRRTTFSTIVSELARSAAQAGIKQRECSLNLEPTEGSETLSQMTITCGYETTYANLTKFMNLLDKSPRFLIIEGLSAAPQQAGNILSVSIKLDTFVKNRPGESL